MIKGHMDALVPRIDRLPVPLRPAYLAFLRQNPAVVGTHILESLLPPPSATFGVAGGVYDLQALLGMYPHLIGLTFQGSSDFTRAQMVAAGRLVLRLPASVRDVFFQHLILQDGTGDHVAACMAALADVAPEEYAAFQDAVQALMGEAFAIFAARWSSRA